VGFNIVPYSFNLFSALLALLTRIWHVFLWWECLLWVSRTLLHCEMTIMVTVLLIRCIECVYDVVVCWLCSATEVTCACAKPSCAITRFYKSRQATEARQASSDARQPRYVCRGNKLRFVIFYATLPISSAMMMFGFPKMSCLSRYSYWQTLHFDLFLFLVTSHRYCHQVWLLMSINVSVHLQQMTVTVSDGQNSFTEYQMSDTVLWSVIYSWEPLVFLNLRLCWILCLAVTFKT